ncbi:hydrogenase maturation protease [Mycolicibacterium hippocampi]|uniref:hydrogenase maturation protease n=1 Tax=Mycolicibacterium hippocampi TaxID=659824 RepID=UPI00351744F5
MNLDEYDDDSCLIYGIGNVGRQDDGLGWAFIDWLEASGCCPSAELQRNYQLLLEDAELISTKRRVLFIDATKDSAVQSFTLQRAVPKMDFTFTSHAISIPAIMATCQQCFQRLPEVHVLAIRGFEFELAMGLTPAAQRNLDDVTAYLSSHRADRLPAR